MIVAVHNVAMHSEQHKIDFSKRLKTALELAGQANLSLSEIANRFNLRHPNKPVSPQAVHSWLIGLSIPTPDKIETLSKWLNVDAQWLRLGKLHEKAGGLSQDELLILKYFRELNGSKQKALISFLHDFQKE